MKVEIEFLGAAGNVTGSKTLLTVNGDRFLIDCGLFQGPKEVRELNWSPHAIPDAHNIKKVILTHAHLDHSGFLPKLVSEGYQGEIVCTQGTADLLQILLMDAAKIQMEDARYANKTKYSNHNPAKALYDTADAEKALDLVKVCPRREWIPLREDTSFRFVRSGHILGASYIQFSFSYGNGVKILTFSGDVGHNRSLILKGPDEILETDFLVLESTYGNRLHERGAPLLELADVINKVCKRQGVLLIPSFAVGRTQEILYMIRQLEEKKLIDQCPVVLDSPMASKANSVFIKNTDDHKYQGIFPDGDVDMVPHQFSESIEVDESMLNCLRDGPLIVIAGAGMLNGGRILHHLKKRLPFKENAVLFVGYQAESTKGQYLQNEAPKTGLLRIHHEEIPVEAEILTLSCLSAHGDYVDLCLWLSSLRRNPRKVFLNHGTPESMTTFEKYLEEKFHWDVTSVLKPEKFRLI